MTTIQNSDFCWQSVRNGYSANFLVCLSQQNRKIQKNIQANTLPFHNITTLKHNIIYFVSAIWLNYLSLPLRTQGTRDTTLSLFINIHATLQQNKCRNWYPAPEQLYALFKTNSAPYILQSMSVTQYFVQNAEMITYTSE